MDPYEEYKEYEATFNGTVIAVFLGIALFFGAILFFIFMVETDDARITQTETYTAEVIEHNSIHGGSEIVLDNGESFRINHHNKYRDILIPGAHIRYHKEDDGSIHRPSLDIISKPDSTP